MWYLRLVTPPSEKTEKFEERDGGPSEEEAAAKQREEEMREGEARVAI